jgi:hypothetical protein
LPFTNHFLVAVNPANFKPIFLKISVYGHNTLSDSGDDIVAYLLKAIIAKPTVRAVTE